MMCRRGWSYLCVAAFVAAGLDPATAATRTKSLKPAAAEEAASLACEAGVVSAAIKASDGDWSYHVYLPKACTPTRKWPVLFIMDPGGGSAETLRRYIDGAELNGWILAVSVQSRNGFDKCREAVQAMVKDVTRRLPADPKRLYSSGFSGGARVAFGLATDEKEFAGVLACGAGGAMGSLSSKAVVYGLCGSNCFNRWDMACSFKAARNKNCRLSFFVGNHDWAGADLITYAMTWMNGCYLASPAARAPGFMEEKKGLSAKIAEQIKKNTETNPERAYEWALCLSLPGDPLQSRKQLQELLRQPKVQSYAAGLKEMDRFVAKHFATNPMDYVKNNGTSRARKDATELAQKHKDTSLEKVFARMGDPSVRP